MSGKICTKCNTEQPIENFAWRSKVKGTRSSWCKACHKELDKVYYYQGNRKQQVQKRNKVVKKRNLELIRDYKRIKGCKICGYKACAAALDFHHEGKEEKKDNISAIFSCSEGTIVEEINKCIVLCCRCHRELHDAEGEVDKPLAFQASE